MRRASSAFLGGAAAAAAFAALPQAARAQESALEEIVVTARFREETLQQTPLAITAITADDLSARGIEAVEEIGAIVPNAYIRPAGATPNVGMRGKVNIDYLSNFQPTVGLYIGDTYYGRQMGMNFELFDVERVEVLRGPQGTLFGKNSLGGAIRLIPRQPLGDDTGYGELAFGSYNELDARVGVDVALTENFFVRATAMSRGQEGYIDRLDFTCQMMLEGTPELAGIGDGWAADDPTDDDILPEAVEPGSEADNAFHFPSRIEMGKLLIGKDSNPCKYGTLRGEDVRGARVALRWTGAENLDVSFDMDFTDNDNESWGSIMKEAPSELSALDERYIMEAIFPRYGLDVDTFTGGTDDPFDGAFWREPEAMQTFETYDDPITNQNFDFGEGIEHWGSSARVVWDMTDTLSLTYIASYREFEAFGNFRSGKTEGDNLPFDLDHNPQELDYHQIQHEIRFDGTAVNSRLAWTAGAFYWTEEEQNYGNIEFEPQTFLGFFPSTQWLDHFETENKSLFLHGVFDVTDRLAVTAGLRHTDEERQVLINHTPFLVLDEPKISSESRIDWRAGVDFQLADNYFLYASAATGFRSSGFQPRAFTPSQGLPFPQEEVLSYELGFKGDLLDDRLRLNIAAFWDNYDPRVLAVNANQCNEFNAPDPGPPIFDDDLIQPGDLCPPGTPLAGLPPFNFSPFISGPGEVKGLEVELLATPFENLTVTFTSGYNQFRGDQDDPEALNYRHPDKLLQPELNMSASVQYDVLLGNGGMLTPRLDWSYTSEETNGDETTPPGPGNIIPDYNLYHARLTYWSPDRDWQVYLQVRNLFDEFYWYAFQAPGGGPAGSPGRPRMWTVGLRKEFGL